LESKHSRKFEVLTTVKISMLVFWLVTPCELVGRYHCFGGAYCLHLQVVFPFGIFLYVLKKITTRLRMMVLRLRFEPATSEYKAGLPTTASQC
jgi:hypothetical protein